MINFIKWLGQFVTDSETSKPSVKRYGLALTFTVLCGIMFGLGVVIAVAVVCSSDRNQVDIVRIAADTINWVSTALITAAGGTYVADRKLPASKKDEPSN